MVRRGGLVTAGLALGVAAGCPGVRPYVCAGDADCDRAGEAGRCLEDGACAYPVDQGVCESGWVRSPNAAQRPGECEPGLGEGTSGTTAATDAGTLGSDSDSDVVSGTVDSGDPPTCGWLAPLVVSTVFLSTSEVLEGYPLLVWIEAPALVAAIAATGDPVVTDAAGVVLAQDLERLDEAAGVLVVWVRLPAYALGEPLPLQLRWGGAAVAGDPAEVWAERYAGVWHMDDVLSGVDGDEIRNSARPSEPGLTTGQMQPEQRVAGVVGQGLQFDGEDDMVSVTAEFVGQLDSYAITFWVRYDGADEGPGDYFQRLNGDYFYPRCWRQANGPVFCQYIVDDAVTSLGASLDQEVGQLLHLAMVRDAAAATTRLYIDGELVNENEDPAGATLPVEGYPFELGHGELGTLPGMLDEVRVSEQALPESWVRADYRTQIEPGVVLESVGEAEVVPCPG
jgi:Concanavalin A-like lectin/glucanases superfamily